MLGDVRTWVRVEIHKQAKEDLLNAQLGPAHRKINELEQTLAKVSSEYDRMKKQRDVALASELEAKDANAAFERQISDLIAQRDVLADQVVSMTPISPALSRKNVEATFQALNETLEEKNAAIEELQAALEDTQISAVSIRQMRNRIDQLEKTNAQQESKIKDLSAAAEVAEAAQSALGNSTAIRAGLSQLVKNIKVAFTLWISEISATEGSTQLGRRCI